MDNKQQLCFFHLINNSLDWDDLSALGSIRMRNYTQKSFAESHARDANKFRGLRKQALFHFQCPFLCPSMYVSRVSIAFHILNTQMRE